MDSLENVVQNIKTAVEFYLKEGNSIKFSDDEEPIVISDDGTGKYSEVIVWLTEVWYDKDKDDILCHGHGYDTSEYFAYPLKLFKDDNMIELYSKMYDKIS